MDITVKGKQIDVGAALRQHATDKLAPVTEKYFSKAIESSVTFSKDAYLIKCDIAIHAGRGLYIHASGESTDAHGSFDTALDTIKKRLRRHHQRLQDHHQSEPKLATLIDSYVLDGRGLTHDVEENTSEATTKDITSKDSSGSDSDGFAPLVIAELQTNLQEMTVADAVMHMDLQDVPALLFYNKSHGGLNMVHRRADGNIGWIDPKGSGVSDSVEASETGIAPIRKAS